MWFWLSAIGCLICAFGAGYCFGRFVTSSEAHATALAMLDRQANHEREMWAAVDRLAKDIKGKGE